MRRERKQIGGYRGEGRRRVRSEYLTGMGFYFGVMKSFGTRLGGSYMYCEC